MKNFRPCEGKMFVKGKFSSVPFKNGKFHMWGMSSTEYESGAVSDTIAIVELEDGKCIEVFPCNLKFTDVGEIENET